MLSGEAYPYTDGSGKTWVMDPATGQKYDVDPNGQVITPNGPEVPWWGAPTQTPKPTTTPKPAITPTGPSLPSLDVQPGLTAQQWEAAYNLTLAKERRERELMETTTQPSARATIDQSLYGIQQQKYANLMGAREEQQASTGLIPRWLPKQPVLQTGGWRQYQEGGMVAPPGYGGTVPGGGGGGATTASDDQAAQAIWDHDPKLQSLYKTNHPDWAPVQSVKDWWGWAPHEGATSLTDYAKKKGWI